jgi:hypothetical protein
MVNAKMYQFLFLSSSSSFALQGELPNGAVPLYRYNFYILCCYILKSSNT